MTGDDGVNAVGNALEQSQRREVVLDRIRGRQVEERHQDVRQHVARDEDASFFDHQRRMARGMSLMLDDAHGGTIPRNLRGIRWQAGDETEQLHRDVLGVLRRQPLGYTVLPVRVREHIPDGSGTAGGTVAGRVAEVRVPEHVVPIRMGGETCHDGSAELAKVVRDGGQFVARYAGVDEQHAVPALHDDGVALDELAFVDQDALGDSLQHDLPSAPDVKLPVERRYYLATTGCKHHGLNGRVAADRRASSISAGPWPCRAGTDRTES